MSYLNEINLNARPILVSFLGAVDLNWKAIVLQISRKQG